MVNLSEKFELLMSRANGMCEKVDVERIFGNRIQQVQNYLTVTCPIGIW